MKKVSKNREKKEQLVAELSEKALKAKAIVLTDYTGLTHKQLEEFKKGLRNADAEFAVTKNRLLKLSLEGVHYDTGDASNFDKPTGTLFMYGDPIVPLKSLAKMIKDFDKPAIKYGILEGKAISRQQVITLASLPSREVLIGQLLGMMNAPISGLHRALNWNLQKLVMTLGAIEKKKNS